MAILVVIVLLLVIMPALIYATGWAVKTYTTRLPQWIHFPPRSETPARPAGGVPKVEGGA